MQKLINPRLAIEVDAIEIRCDCKVCGITILVPAATVEPPVGSKPYTAKKRALVIHNLVQGRRLFGYPNVG